MPLFFECHSRVFIKRNTLGTDRAMDDIALDWDTDLGCASMNIF